MDYNVSNSTRRKVIIFGLEQTSQLAHYYLDVDSPHEVVAFSVHEKYMDKERFCGLPVIPFEKIEKDHSPSEFKFLVPLYATKMNTIREKVYLEIKEKGYSFVNYISSKAYTWNCDIGENCMVLEGSNLQPFSKVGNNVIIWSKNHIGHHSVIEDNCYITGLVAVSGNVTVGKNSFLGGNCTIRDGIKLAEGTFIAMDASVQRAIEEPWGVYKGTPARVVKGVSSMKINL